MRLKLDGQLAYVHSTIHFSGEQLRLERVLVDTGSGGSVFAADLVRRVGIRPEGTDRIRRIYGVGGSEFVYSKRVNQLTVGDLSVDDFEIQVGALSYGFPLDGIIGMDFLLATRAVIDLDSLEIR